MKIILVFFLSLTYVFSQQLPTRWDELVASDWQAALDKSARTCILPFGILEKHGLHSPLGTDLIHVREWAAKATQKEYAVVFPDYFYGQINEAKQQPGTFALPSKVVWDLLEATCDEMARNGFKKILILNGHGGNPELIRYFIQTRLENKKDYAVFFYTPQADKAFTEKVNKLRKTDPAGDQHGGETETSILYFLKPELMKLDRATNESGENLKRWSIPNVYTGIWWYASYPNHYAGEGAKATKELGKLLFENEVESFAKAIKAVKEDTKTLEIQNQYYDNFYKDKGK